MNETSPKAGWFGHISTLLSRKLEDREQLIALLHSAHERNLLGTDALAMIEGVLQVSEMQVRDVMIPRSQMDTIDINEKPEEVILFVTETAHSRFPVTDGSKDQVVGVLLAKDLLHYYSSKKVFNIRDMLRPVIYIPESKKLNILLKDFRSNRAHIAIVVDEYGGVAGLITIEDVLEQIVGDIEDEYDSDEDEAYIVADTTGYYRVKAIAEISSFNETLGATFSDKDFDTIGGLVISEFGRLPENGESIIIGNFSFTVVRADSRRLHLLKVERVESGATDIMDL